MSCSPFNLRDYFFGELPEEERRQVDLHTKGCAACSEELNCFRSTQATLLSVPDEEIPQRIGFVSDRVYEPSRLMRWWRAFWGSAPRLGFASAAMLSAAILVFTFHRPGPTTLVAQPVDVVRLQADFKRQINEAVEKAVAESDARNEQRTAQLLTAASRQFDEQRQADIEFLAKYARRDFRTAMFSRVSQ